MTFDFRNCEENIESVARIHITEYDNDYGNQNTLPGVMQFESNLFSVGRVSPDSLAFLSKASASRADLKIKLYMKY